MTNKQIQAQKNALPRHQGCWLDMTDDQKQTHRELECREMINSILVYNVRPGETEHWSSDANKMISIEDYLYNNQYLQCYINGKEYYHIGGERVRELIREQIADYGKCEVGYAGTLEGVSYNYCKWEDEQD